MDRHQEAIPLEGGVVGGQEIGERTRVFGGLHAVEDAAHE
jgi:hypothetical protein